MSQKPPNNEIDDRRDAKEAQPVLKIQAIALLRFLIRLLEGTVETLEAKLPPEDLPRRTPTSSGWWNVVLRNIRAVLPKLLNQVLSDFTLILGISVAILILPLWIIILISPTEVVESPTVEAEKPPTEVVESPTVEAEKPPTEVVESPTVEAEKPPTEVVEFPTVEAEKPPIEVVESPSVEAEEPTTEVAESPSIEAEEPPTEVAEFPSVEAEEPPTEVVESPEIPSGPVPVEIVPAPVLMPKENLVAIIQNQVADRIPEAEYAQGLIQSLKADFNNNLLVVKVSYNWYYISPENQNEFAQSMRQISQEIDFYKLEITDTEDTLLARSPVVGPKMVIFQRRLVLSH
ncbi:MAG: hypothetical protein GDA48_15850 [Hormoscilla sp. GM102CHS1]|nr:hypothetical protein [Hormoscilla sp. GM102CHS1]